MVRPTIAVAILAPLALERKMMFLFVMNIVPDNGGLLTTLPSILESIAPGVLKRRTSCSDID